MSHGNPDIRGSSQEASAHPERGLDEITIRTQNGESGVLERGKEYDIVLVNGVRINGGKVVHITQEKVIIVARGDVAHLDPRKRECVTIGESR